MSVKRPLYSKDRQCRPFRLFNVITDLTSLQGLEMNGAAPSGHIAKEVFK